MMDYYAFEHIKPILGDEYDECLGVVQARTNQSALNKARKQYKYDRGGVPARRRISDNIWVRPIFSFKERRTK